MSTRQPKVTILRIYDVICDAETCNGSIMESDFATTRQEAEQNRRDHLQQHKDGWYGDGGNPEAHAGHWKEYDR